MDVPAVSDGHPYAPDFNSHRAVINTQHRIAKQVARQSADRRGKLLLSTDGAVTLTTVQDATLTKSYPVNVTGQPDGTNARLTPAQIAACPFDLGTPGFMKSVYAASGFGYLWSAPSIAATGVPNPSVFTVSEPRLMTNSPKIQFTLYRVNGQNNMGHTVFVDGVPMTVRPQVGTSVVDFVTLTFPDSKDREIAIRTSALIGSILIKPLYDCWKPEPRTGPSMYTIGDSYSAPVVWTDDGTAAALQEEGLAAGLEDGLGISDHYIDAIGGTGWTMRVSGAAQGPNNNYVDRWPQVLRVNPDVLVVPNGACNDVANYVPPSVIAQSIKACFQQLRNQNPNTKFVYADGYSPPLSTFAPNLAGYAVLRAMLIPYLSQIGVYYIDTITSPWIYGSGTITSKTGTGNSDLYVGNDQAHLSGLGYRYLKQRINKKLERILIDDGSLVNTVL